jgi:hypothetical protein
MKGRPKEVRGGGGHFTFYVNPSLIEEFQEALPRRKSVSEALREHIESVIQERQKQKKQEALQTDLSAVKPFQGNMAKHEEINQCLDAWMQEEISLDALIRVEGKARGFVGYIDRRKKLERMVTFRK